MQQQMTHAATTFLATTANPNKTNPLNNNQTSMKNNFLFVAFFFLALGATAQNTQRNALKINPLSLVVATGNVSYERAVSNSHSFQVGGFYSGAGIDNFNYRGYGI